MSKAREAFKSKVNQTLNTIFREENTKKGGDRYFDKNFFDRIEDKVVRQIHEAFLAEIAEAAAKQALKGKPVSEE